MKIVYTLIFFFLFTSAFAQTNLKSGLVACYPFNANARDESGNGNNGTVNGATLTTDRFGKSNSAYYFDGSGTQYIEVSSNNFQNDNYSFSIWANPEVLPSVNTYFYPFSVGGSGGDQSLDLSNAANGATGWTFGGYSVGGGRVPFCHQGFLPPASRWYHIVGVRDDNTMRLYVDGILVMTDNTNGYKPSYGTNTKVTIGCRSSLVQFFQGKVDDIHVYNRALNAAEVKALYEGNSAATITINTDKIAPCGGDNVIFTATGASSTAQYQWKVDGVNVGTNSKTFTYNSANKTVDYQVKVSVEVKDEEVCFPQKPVTVESTVTIKNCTPPPTAVDLKSGLVACYPFNANANDATGNGNNGTVNGATLTTDRFGKVNSAYNFNGINQFITVPDSPTLKFGQISIALWIKATQFREFTNSAGTWDRYGGPICRDTRPSGIWNGFTTTTSHGLLRFNSTLMNDTYPDVGVENSITLNNWIFLVFIVDNGISKIYKDGVLVATNSSFSGNKMAANNNPIYIGRGFWLPSGVQLDAYFTGVIDDIHIYNRPLNAAEVKALYDGNNVATITINANKVVPCGGDNVTFTATGASSTAQYQWKVDGVNVGTNSKTFTYNSANKTVDYQVKVLVEVKDEEVCFPQKTVTADKTINIKYCSTPVVNTGNKILIPNAFSPNADGMNDTWEIFGIAGSTEVIVEIYNRWGELVYYTKNYNEQWNGMYRNQPAPEGTYAYVIRLDNETVLKGTILLIR